PTARGYVCPVTCPSQKEPPPCEECDCPPYPPGPPGPGPGPGPQQWGPSPGPPGCSACLAPGVPIFWISEPSINIRVEDTPLWWIPARGSQPISLKISYRQRGVISEDPTIFGLGQNWSCSF